VADCKAAYLLVRVLKELCSSVKVILADGGYRGGIIETVKHVFGYAIEVVAGNFKEQGFRPIHKRWTVERTFFRFDNYRRLCRKCKLTFDSGEDIVKIASIKIIVE
jgi:putative transposase